MAEKDRKILYLIDGHAQFFRAYYAIRTGMTSPVTHEPTNMTYGFVGMLLMLLRDYAPDYLAVAIDVSGDRESFRSQLYPDYKAHRESPPDDFGPQVDRCLALLDTMHVPVVGVEGVEADDVIATLVRRLRAGHPDLHIRVVSRDKDLAQMLDDGVELFDVHRNTKVTPAEIFRTEGVKPAHVVDILALMGDNVDNIPGVAGIGPKTAAKLILQYGSLDNLLAHLDEITGKRRENIEAARDQLALSRQLVTLKDDVDVEFDLESAAVDATRLPYEDLSAAFRELAFGQHEDTLRALVEGKGGDRHERTPSSATSRESNRETNVGGAATAASPVVTRAAAPDALDDGLFAEVIGAAARVRREPNGNYRAVTTAEALDDVVAEIRAAGACAVDTETDSVHPMRARLCGVSIATAPGAACYIPVRSPAPGTHLDETTVLDALRPLLEDATIAKVGHNLKYDINVFRRHGVRVAGELFDTMIASYVVDATRSSHRLDVLALALLGLTTTSLRDLIGRGRGEKGFDTVPLDDAVPYAAEDADIALRLRDVFRSELETMDLWGLFTDVEMPLVEVLAEIEYNGIRVDPKELARQREKLTGRTEALRDEIAHAAPHPFNPDSPKQLAVALFNKPGDDPPGLGIKVLKRGKTGPSTDVEVLEKLTLDPDVDSKVPELLIEYRQLTKLVNTYLVSLAGEIHPETGRVHASFNQTVAATGRLSSSDPNLQNIPIRTDIGREIRRAFVAEPGNELITADYSQIELRLLAHLSGDEGLAEAFRSGMDIHTVVAAEVYGVAPDEVTATQRGSAKMVNFGIVYGITPWGLARRLGAGTSVEEATRIISDYKKRFPAIDAFLAECVGKAERDGYVETILKRRRNIPQIRARHPQQRALGERMAINTVVQGSAADLIKVAMIDLHRCVPARFPDARMLLQIHDELVFEASVAVSADLQAFVVERMEGAMELSVPLVADAARSTSWIDAK